ncbi:MAG: ABC transporter ATP-binding protein [Chloroflexi bacterium]|nr:MAG: ABC transporter ATP-binding protein [Chloroflexota bacterium]MBL1196068.1 ABC transporter ATP-binding protein [Chloroflexota bacterium]
MIEIDNLTKRYGGRPAVRELSLEVQSGDIFGFVGPNGAGKTSTIRVMTTLLHPTAGDIRVGGHSVIKEAREVRSQIGYMPDFFGVYNDMMTWEYLDFFGACYEIPQNERKGLVEDLLELVDLTHRRNDPVEKLSRGMKQRLSLARTLVHDPQVLILDEPASGLDPRARAEIRALLLELARIGKTIFFSTHILADVAEICTRVGILEAGELAAFGTPEELQQQLMPTRRVQITVLKKLKQAMSILNKLPGVTFPENEEENGNPNKVELDFYGTDEDLSALLAKLVDGGVPVLHFTEEGRDMESVFLRATKGLVT